MYALVNQNELILGPIGFNYRLINSALNEELEVPYRVVPTDHQNVPIIFDENIRIIPARNENPPYDPRFQVLKGPVHTITETEAVFVYTVENKSLEQIKDERKDEIPPVRWRKENQTITLTVQDREIQVSTDRENRLALVSKLVSTEAPYHFKFGKNIWLEITKEELQYILEEIDVIVQEAFDWELSKVNEIDACETGEEVYAVEIQPPIIYEN